MDRCFSGRSRLRNEATQKKGRQGGEEDLGALRVFFDSLLCEIDTSYFGLSLVQKNEMNFGHQKKSHVNQCLINQISISRTFFLKKNFHVAPHGCASTRKEKKFFFVPRGPAWMRLHEKRKKIFFVPRGPAWMRLHEKRKKLVESRKKSFSDEL
jgi:hypothetical protein